MNLSLIIIEKLKAYFELSDKEFISLADLARVLDKEDFSFLGSTAPGQGNTTESVAKAYETKHYFSYLANSLSSKNEITWNPEVNQERTLDKVYAATLENAVLDRKEQGFVNKWLYEQKELELAIVYEPKNNIPFLETSCTPGFYQEINQPWQKIVLKQEELKQLDTLARNEYPDHIYTHIDPILNGEKLDLLSFSFELKLVSVLRNWFDRGLLESRNWKTEDGEILSNGENSHEGKLPAYPGSMIFIKNVSWELVPGTPNNVSALKKIQEGNLNLGNLMVEGIPKGANLGQLTTLNSACIKPSQLQVFNQNIQFQLKGKETNVKANLSPEVGKMLERHTLPNNVFKPIPNVGSLNTGRVSNPVSPSVNLAQKGAFAKLSRPGLNLDFLKLDLAGSTKNVPLYFQNNTKALYLNRAYFNYYSFFYDTTDFFKETYTVSGYVRNKTNNAPVKDALVTILFGHGKRLTATTDSNGWYSIARVSKGNINIEIQKSDFGIIEENLLLSNNFNRDYALVPLATAPKQVNFFLFGMLNTRLPLLPNPSSTGEFVDQDQAVTI